MTTHEADSGASGEEVAGRRGASASRVLVSVRPGSSLGSLGLTLSRA